jgi:hypothetical protein
MVGRRQPTILCEGHAGQGGAISYQERAAMPDLFAVVLASLPFILFVLLVIETLRNTPSAGEGLPIDLFHRSFGA